MSDERYPEADPREWLRFARGDALVAHADIPGARLETFCFHAQQAAEKAIKGVLLLRGIPFPRTHDLDRLLDLLEEQEPDVPGEVRGAGCLTQFAVEGRYPMPFPQVTPEELSEALAQADAVVRWAENQILAGERPSPATEG